VKAAIEKLKPDALQRLRRFAKRGAYQLALAGEPIAPDEHEQILHDAITDTMSLVVTWNRHAGMEKHLYNVILRRISNGLRRTAKRPGVSLARSIRTMPRPQPLPIDLEVKAAIEKLSPAMLQKLTQFARRGVFQLARAGEPVAADEHEQIVHDAIADTLSLEVAWDRRVKMELHLFNVVRRRLWNALRRANTRARVPLDALDTEHDAARVSRDGEPEASLGRAQVTRRLFRVVRERAADDPAVLSILDAYQAEESDRRAVMARAGLVVPEYVNARRRLDRLLAGLPDELRSAALAAMRNPGVP
jgi:DNA-directed RNA polymerase specialized sigma24 family protein